MTPAKKTTTRRPTGRSTGPRDRLAARTVTEAVDGCITPLDLDAEPAYDPDTAEKVHLFTLHGVDHFVDAQPRANISLQFMARYRRDPVEAQDWLLEEILGGEAYTALRDWDGLTNAHLLKLTTALQKLTMGGVEDSTRPLGRS